AAQVFAERGYHRATIKDVARAAGVSDGSIYNVFENKTALLLSLLDPLAAASISPGTWPAEEVDASARLEGHIRQRWDAFSPETLQVLRAVLSEALVNDELRQLFFSRVLAPALDRRRIDAATGVEASAAGADTDVALRPLVGAMMGLILLRLLGDEVTAQQWETFPGRLAQLFSPMPV
ncbi:MAG TPA: TetR/AcrR family transcriptional regulator, partial [Gemmatimonadales bacterium]|nr:TetR/AcrR family transcriptional regulator [Gemmatimonadales bacterium]